MWFMRLMSMLWGGVHGDSEPDFDAQLEEEYLDEEEDDDEDDEAPRV